MSWLVWLIVIVVVVLLIVGAFLYIQARRRRGGVIIEAGTARNQKTRQVMTRLMRTSEITKRPVVTMGGEDVAQIKDVVYSAGGGEVGGFTLAGRGLFSGPKKESLAWPAVSALGADAVMISDESVLEPTQKLLDASASTGGSGGNVLGSRVLTDGGMDLGEVVDVIVDVPEPGTQGQFDVVGYEIEASESMGTKGTKLLIPLPDTIAASAEHLMVPASAKDFVSQDLAGFGAAVDAFRKQLEV